MPYNWGHANVPHEDHHQELLRNSEHWHGHEWWTGFLEPRTYELKDYY